MGLTSSHRKRHGSTSLAIKDSGDLIVAATYHMLDVSNALVDRDHHLCPLLASALKSQDLSDEEVVDNHFCLTLWRVRVARR